MESTFNFGVGWEVFDEVQGHICHKDLVKVGHCQNYHNLQVDCLPVQWLIWHNYISFRSLDFGDAFWSPYLITLVKGGQKARNVFRFIWIGRKKGYETHLDGNEMIIFAERLLLLFHFSTSRKLKDNWEYIFQAIAPVSLK